MFELETVKEEDNKEDTDIAINKVKPADIFQNPVKDDDALINRDRESSLVKKELKLQPMKMSKTSSE